MNSPKKQSAPMKYNALKHGLFTREALLPFENRRDYLRFRRNVINSLNPSNDLERHVANDIADDAWRVRRHDDQIFAQKQKLYDQLTPQMVAEMGGVPQSLHGAAPTWLTDMQHKISTPIAQFAQKVCDQYLDCKKNFASIPNLVAVHKQYAVLFYSASQRAKIIGKREVINEVTKTIDAAWQAHTKELWELLEEVYEIAYYQANWKTIRQNAQPWIESWYFLKESESSKIEHLKALGIKARADFRKQLQAYERLKKNQHTFSPLLKKLAIDPDPDLSVSAAQVQEQAKAQLKAQVTAPSEVQTREQTQAEINAPIKVPVKARIKSPIKAPLKSTIKVPTNSCTTQPSKNAKQVAASQEGDKQGACLPKQDSFSAGDSVSEVTQSVVVAKNVAADQASRL